MADNNAKEANAKKSVETAKSEQKTPAKEKVSIGSRVKKFIKDYRAEIKKIVWPSRTQVIKNTTVVVTVIIFVSLFVGLLDSLFVLGINALGQLGSLLQ